MTNLNVGWILVGIFYYYLCVSFKVLYHFILFLLVNVDNVENCWKKCLQGEKNELVVDLFIHFKYKEIWYRKVSDSNLFKLWFVLSFSDTDGNWSYNPNDKYGMWLFNLIFVVSLFSKKNWKIYVNMTGHGRSLKTIS